MNQTESPSVHGAISGLVFPKSDAPKGLTARKECEVACVDLVSRLENWLVKARELDHDDLIDQSGKLGQSMIEILSTFSDNFLTGKAAAQVDEEIARAITTSLAYGEILSTRPLKNALLRTFWKVEESKEIMDYHEKLGETLVRASVVTCYHAVALLGVNTGFGKVIDQSTIEFVNDFKAFWS